MEFLFAPITFVDAGDVVIKMHIFELTAMVLVMLQIWLYGRLSLWGPIWGGVGAFMWITMGYRADPTMWGLIILNVIILYLQVANYMKWKKAKVESVASEVQEGKDLSKHDEATTTA